MEVMSVCVSVCPHLVHVQWFAVCEYVYLLKYMESNTSLTFPSGLICNVFLLLHVRLINLQKIWKLYKLCSKQRNSCVIALNVVICLRIFLFDSRGVYMPRLYFVCSSRVNGCCLWWWWCLLPEVWGTSCLFVFGQHGVMDERKKRY